MDIEEHQLPNKILVGKTTRNKIISETIKPPFVNISHSMFIFSPPNSGKSCLINSLLLSKTQYGRCFDNIYLICPPTSRDCFGENSAMNMVSKDKTYDDLNEETLLEIINKVDADNDIAEEDGEQEFHLLIIDDCYSELVHDKAVIYLIKKLLANHRHKNLTLWVSNQSYMIPKRLRELFRTYLFFNPVSLKEMERINWEILPQFSRKEFEKLMEYSFDKKYNYLLVDKLNNTCCKNMNMLKIKCGDKTLVDINKK
tara:strand:+ start:1201 stop:1968 length:768 start_codon:yes stop_codon:yes gene_type:complete